jgi:lysophospholipase
LGTVERSYLDARQAQLDSAWQSQTSRLGLTMPSRTPKVAMSLSGGGYRAMIHGSGQAFLQNTTEGSVGDVLGLTTYVGGLSGGSWAISSWLANDGAQPDYLVKNVSSTRFLFAFALSVELCWVRELILFLSSSSSSSFF